jgi:hypothetical protein
MIIELMNKGEHLTIDGLKEILRIKASINKGLTEELKTVFPDIIPVDRPLVELQKSIDPN